ncbi:hypothetical protein [uncultured Croceitalea sp.]|uniref:hypothetical protein n=1 Tax=uncultured Croceitalea sp. TaxID=1798908 RepID=UPI0033065F77
MSQFFEIYKTFSVVEKKNFTTFLKKRNRRGDAKNLELLRLLERNETKGLDVKLYGKPAKGAFHALSKRLSDALVDFVASNSFADETSKELEAMKLLLASRIFFEQKMSDIAFKTIQRSESKAFETDNYAILNEIYHTKIQYAHLNTQWVLSELIKAAERNRRLLVQDMQLNMAYAKIKSELTYNTSASVSTIVSSAFSEFQLEITEDLTYKSLYQLMEITATTAKLQRDFYTISPFMRTVFARVEEKGEVAEKYTYYYLNIRCLMAVTDFRNKDFDASKTQIEHIEAMLSKSKKAYQQLFSGKLEQLKALNESYTGNIEKAIALLSNAADTSLTNKLLLVMCFFQKAAYQKAYGLMLTMAHTDDWYLKKMDWPWVLKKNIVEILLLIELDKLDLVMNRFQRFSRRFHKKLKEEGEERVLVFMALAKEYYESPEVVTTSSFKAKVEDSFEWLGREQEDIFVMSFYAWLKAKMENRDLYEVTLELVNAKANL